MRVPPRESRIWSSLYFDFLVRYNKWPKCLTVPEFIIECGGPLLNGVTHFISERTTDWKFWLLFGPVPVFSTCVNSLRKSHPDLPIEFDLQSNVNNSQHSHLSAALSPFTQRTWMGNSCELLALCSFGSHFPFILMSVSLWFGKLLVDIKWTSCYQSSRKNAAARLSYWPSGKYPVTSSSPRHQWDQATDRHASNTSPHQGTCVS